MCFIFLCVPTATENTRSQTDITANSAQRTQSAHRYRKVLCQVASGERCKIMNRHQNTPTKNKHILYRIKTLKIEVYQGFLFLFTNPCTFLQTDNISCRSSNTREIFNQSINIGKLCCQAILYPKIINLVSPAINFHLKSNATVVPPAIIMSERSFECPNFDYRFKFF